MLAVKKDSNIGVIDYLIENGANLSERNNNGYNAMLLSVINTKNPQNFQHLLKLGADLNTITKDELGLNVLMVAILNNSSCWVIKTIIKSGIDINEKDNSGNTALEYAKKQNNTEIINALILDVGI